MATTDDLTTTILSFHNMHEHGSVFVNLLKARCDAFIVKNRWSLPMTEGLEYDQYDNPSSRWIAVHRGEEVLAGVRLTPTTAKCGMYSYMIRDAQLKLLAPIPANLLDFEAPIDPDIWEASRIFVAGNVPSHLRTCVQTMLMKGLIKAAREKGAKQLLGLVPAVWSRWIGRLGLLAEPAGPVLNMEGWRTQVALMHLTPMADGMKVDQLGGSGKTPAPDYSQGIIQRVRLRKYLHLARAAE